MNTNLIEQLSKLTPTEGEWIYRNRAIYHKEQALILFRLNHYPSEEEGELVSLAPTMRLEILAMAKEIEFLNTRIEHLTLALKS